jgi:AraC-like DNA-binding protein
MSDSTDTRIQELNSEWNQHKHTHHQLVLGLTGQIQLQLADQKIITFERQHACLIPSECWHAFHGEENNRVLVIDIDPSDARIDAMLLSRLFYQPKFLLLDSQLVKLISTLSDELSLQNRSTIKSNSLLSRNPSVKTADIQPHFISLILFSLQHRLQQENVAQDKPSNDINSRLNIEGLNHFILENLAEKISIDELARFCHMSSSQFHLRFRQHTGITPHQYLLQQRTERAIWLLRNSGLTIAQIAADTGFTNQSALNHVIKAKLNTSPGQVRKDRHKSSIQSF